MCKKYSFMCTSIAVKQLHAHGMESYMYAHNIQAQIQPNPFHASKVNIVRKEYWLTILKVVFLLKIILDEKIKCA